MRYLLLIVLFVPIPGFAETQCPPNSHPDILGRGCMCNAGYEVKNNQCIKIKVPDNASTSILGGWQCNTGYIRKGNECDKVVLPDNASFIYGGTWTCNTGYQQRGNQCIKVNLPDNAHFTFGSMWECNAGFTKNGKSCRKMNRDELVNQVRLLNQMLIMQMSKQTGGDCSSGFDACEDECDDQFSSYYDEKKCVEACEEGKDACD